MIRILQVTKELGSGGIENIICGIYHNIDRTKVQFDFAIHWDEEGMHEEEVKELGANIYRFKTLKQCGSVHKYKEQWIEFWNNDGKKYEIVHAHYMSHEGMIMCIAKKFNKITFAHSHSTIKLSLKSFLVKFMNRNLVKDSDFLIACSQRAAIDFFGRKHGGGGAVVVKNAINVDEFVYNLKIRKDLRNKFNIDDKFVIGHVGNYTHHKNQDFMLKVFSEIIKRRKDALLIWVGYINEKDIGHINSLLREYHIENNVLLIGRSNDINHWMQAFDIFLFPSLYEGLGIVLIEAQAAGLRCIISETIPPEAEVTNILVRCNLNDSAEKWSEVLLKNSVYVRKDYKDQIKDSGYDIKEVSLSIEKLYLNAIKNI